MSTADPQSHLALPTARHALTVALALALSACGGTNGNDASPIPSTGVPEAARAARGVRVADHSTPAPTTGSPDDPFGVDPYNGSPPGSLPQVPPPLAPPLQAPTDPFGAPPTAPTGAAPPAPPSPPKPPPTGVPL